MENAQWFHNYLYTWQKFDDKKSADIEDAYHRYVSSDRKYNYWSIGDFRVIFCLTDQDEEVSYLLLGGSTREIRRENILSLRLKLKEKKAV